MGPAEPRRLDDMRRKRAAAPDLTETRLTAIDVVSLTEVEIRATLVHLAGDPDPVVRDAVLDATRRVLQRTRTT